MNCVLPVEEQKVRLCAKSCPTSSGYQWWDSKPGRGRLLGQQFKQHGLMVKRGEIQCRWRRLRSPRSRPIAKHGPNRGKKTKPSMRNCVDGMPISRRNWQAAGTYEDCDRRDRRQWQHLFAAFARTDQRERT